MQVAGIKFAILLHGCEKNILMFWSFKPLLWLLKCMLTRRCIILYWWVWVPFEVCSSQPAVHPCLISWTEELKIWGQILWCLQHEQIIWQNLMGECSHQAMPLYQLVLQTRQIPCYPQERIFRR
jgi:hypothetical protein